MNRLRNIFAIGAFSLLVLALPSFASAQYRNDDSYGNNGRNGNNGRYGDIRGTVQSLKNKARNLEQRSDRIDDRRNDRYNDRNNGRYGNNNYGNLEQLTDRFRNATDDLAGAYGRGRNLNGSADEARRVLDIGSQIDQEIGRSRGSRNMQNQWGSIRNDLRIIAQTYGLNYNGNRGGSWRDRLPF
ncbi:MAG: hypothetical protein ABI791_02665 [Acidobacteriota bacterium]